MKTIVPLLILTLTVLACGRFQSQPASNPGNASNSAKPPAPGPVSKVADVPSLLGKSKDEVKKLVTGRVVSDTAEEIKFDFPQGRLSISFNPGIGRPIGFALPLGSDIDGAGDTKERLGELVGVDMKGRIPTKTDSFGTHYENETLNGRSVRIVFTPTMPGREKFYEIRVSPK